MGFDAEPSRRPSRPVRAKTGGPDVYKLVGLIFTLVGAIVLGLGLWMTFDMDNILEHAAHVEGDPGLLPVMFVPMGGLTFAVGLTCLIQSARKRRALRDLMASGFYVTAEIVGESYDMRVRFNGRPATRYTAVYWDSATGESRQFMSDAYGMPLSPSPVGSRVRVYLEKPDFRCERYHVDMLSIGKSDP